MAQGISTVIIDRDTDSLNVISKYIKNLGDNASVEGVATDFEGGYELIHRKKPMVVLMEVCSDDMERALERMKMVVNRFPQISIFAMCEDKSSDTILRVMRAGATEYLLKPVSEVDLVSSLQKIGRLWVTKPSPEPEAGQMLTFFSPKGGVGVTTLAINTAFNIHHITQQPTIIVDLDLEAGDVTTFLNLKPNYTISDVTVNMARLDKNFLQGVITKHESGVYVLAEPQRIEEGASITGEEIRKVLGLLKTMFKYVVVDTEAGLNDKTTAVIEMSDVIFLTFVMSLPGIKNMQRYLQYFDKQGYRKSKIKLLVNRYLHKGDIQIEDAEKILKHNIFWYGPNDHSTAIASLNKGVPIGEFEPKSKLNLAIKNLATSLVTRSR
jgi:pilus assembly protein CpaE